MIDCPVERVTSEAKIEGISQDKMRWLESIQACRFKEPVSFMCWIADSRTMLSEREVREMPLDELKAMYNREVERSNEKKAVHAQREQIAVEEIRARFKALENIALALLSGHATPDERGKEWDDWAELFSTAR